MTRLFAILGNWTSVIHRGIILPMMKHDQIIILRVPTVLKERLLKLAKGKKLSAYVRELLEKVK